jgi:hypothetical protein
MEAVCSPKPLVPINKTLWHTEVMYGNFQASQVHIIENVWGSKITACHKYWLIICLASVFRQKELKWRGHINETQSIKVASTIEIYNPYFYLYHPFLLLSCLSSCMYEEWGLPVAWICQLHEENSLIECDFHPVQSFISQ